MAQKLPQIISKYCDGNDFNLKNNRRSRSLQLGLVNHVVPSVDLAQKALKIAALCSKISPESTCAAIKSVNSCYSQSGEEIETEEFSKLFETSNFKRGECLFGKDNLILINA